jgi:cephalosporin hydroxylase
MRPLDSPQGFRSDVVDRAQSGCMADISTNQPINSRLPRLPRRWSFEWMLIVLQRAHNRLRRTVLPPSVIPSISKELSEIREHACTPSDIDEHLEWMFTEALLLQPRLIVELGVRDGQSTFVFERVANLCAASIVSVDIDDCSRISSHPRWHFVRGDDVEVSYCFGEFCRARNLPPSVDLLFVDTSHYFEHTLKEIRAWFPLLSPRAKVMFHDTNMRLIGHRRDGCFQPAWENERGVIRAVENYLGIDVDETREYVDYAKGWVVRHRANCNGFTVLDKFPSHGN